MALIVGTDSFASLEEAAAHNAAHPFGAAWGADSLTDAERETYARLATRLLNDTVRWRCRASTETQVLVFPAQDLVSLTGRLIPNTEIPVEIVRATSELSRRLVNNSALLDDQELEVLDIRRSGRTNFGGGAIRKPIPDAVMDYIPNDWYENVYDSVVRIERGF